MLMVEFWPERKDKTMGEIIISLYVQKATLTTLPFFLLR